MAKMEKYLAPLELRAVANICEALTKAYEDINAESDVSVSFFEDDEGCGQTVKAYDCNGEVIGHIGFGESGGFVMYLENDDNA